MKTEKATLIDAWHGREDRTVTIAYVEREHWDTVGTSPAGRPWKAYDVIVDGEPVGHVEQAEESTDRHYGRIRVPGKGRVAWGWRTSDGKRNAAGCYEATRSSAVARMLGYSRARKERA